MRVVEVHDEADEDLVVLDVVDEGPAAGVAAERPAHGVGDLARAVGLAGATSQISFMPRPYFCGSRPSARP